MSNFKMDLSKFKHVKSDDQSTTLRHSDGHLLKIAHKSLSPDMQKQLGALSQLSKDAATPSQRDEMRDKKLMAEGGDVADGPTLDYSKFKNKPKEGGDTLDYSGYKWETQEKNRQESKKALAKPVKRKMYAAGSQQLINSNDSAPTEETDSLPADASADNAQSEGSTEPLMSSIMQGAGDPTSFKPQLPSEMYANTSDREINWPSEALITHPSDPLQMYTKPSEGSITQSTQSEVPETSTADQIGAQVAQASKQPDQGMTAQQPKAGGEDLSNFQSLYQKGAAAAMGAIAGEQKVKSELAQKTAEVEQQRQAALHSAQSAWDSTVAEHDQERQNILKDIQAGFISPEKYWTGIKNPQTGEVEGSHSKLMSGIGMILAGFNPTNNPNAAVDFLKYQINKNVEAQAQNLQANQNLLASNLAHFKNAKDAMDMTRLMVGDYAASKLTEEAAKLGTPAAAAAAQKAKSDLYLKELMPTAMQLNMRTAMMNMSKPQANGQMPQPGALEAGLSTLDMTNPEMAKQYRERLVAGVYPNGASALANRPIPEASRTALQDMSVLSNKTDELLKFIKEHRGSLNPQTRALGAQKAEEVLNFYNNSLGASTLTEGRLDWYNKQISKDPVGFFNDVLGNSKRLEEIKHSNDVRRSSLMRTFGINVPAPSQANDQQMKMQQTQDYIKNNPNTPKAIKLQQLLQK